MPPISLNRRRFLGCSAAAGLALSQGRVSDADTESTPIRLGVIGLGTRGTTLLRTLLELPATQVVAVCDLEPRHRLRGLGIVEKARGVRPEGYERATQVLERADIDAVAVALPCDLHASINLEAMKAGKHVYAEKPLALTLAECDLLLAESARSPELIIHVGFQRRSNPRYRAGVNLIHQGEIGNPLTGHSVWLSSNGPMNGSHDWLARRARSGDWMVEQAVHVWDVFNWLASGPPTRATGRGRRDLFSAEQPQRDVTDHYSAELEWADGFHVSFTHTWIAPPDERFTGVTLQVMGDAGGIDFSSGAVTFRDRGRPRQTLHPGNQPDTRLALQAFLDAVRAESPASPPLSLAEARNATATGLLVRKAVDERRSVTMAELGAEAGSSQTA